MKTGIANVPLHGGHCPPWLFEKMKQLGAAMVEVIVLEYGPSEVLRRLSDPVWFQTFGSVMGFDWHSSGLTTVVCGALKEGLSKSQGELGVFFAGGKGKASRQTPLEIVEAGEKYGLSNDLVSLQETSRLVAKIDSAAVQDGYQLYHHFFIFDRDGNWAVIQQGMNEENRYARRYHWLSENLRSFVNDPHSAICGLPETNVLNLVYHANQATREASVELCREKPERVSKIYQSITAQNQSKQEKLQLSLFEEKSKQSIEPDLASPAESLRIMTMPKHHPIPSSKYLDKILYQLYERPPGSYKSLIETPGVGSSTLRALAMVAEVTHGVSPSFQDPVRYTFAHGGKDGYPFPVQRNDITHSIEVLHTAIAKAKLGEKDKLNALRKLAEGEQRLLTGSC